MIRDRSDFWFHLRRSIIVSFRISYRWICNHPFLLGFVSFLVLLYRTCPVVFSLLVSASPVLVCTAVLLGTILSFGQPNIPEIEEEPEVVHETALFKTDVARDDTVVERDDQSFTVERFFHMEKDDVGRVLGQNQSHVSKFEEDEHPSVDYRPLVDGTFKESKRENHVKFELEPLKDLEKSREAMEEKLIADRKDEHIDVSSPVSPWRPMRQDDDGEDDDDDADSDDSSDSGSDGAESSSPDASMTDIIPMLDELHPLLHSEGPNPSMEGSEGPHRSGSGSDDELESDSDIEADHGEEGDNENEDEEEEEEEEEEDEEETKEDKEDESKSAIKWTEDDQKNVMDLGSLELERNQRLESLIARRRARQSMKSMAEKNLIDLDSFDEIPFNMPSISTARRNPFELPYDSYDNMGLPPIPGSAPSIMAQRRNPFDIPYDPNEEKPDLKGDDGFQEEFSHLPTKEAMFRRHESFSVGSSMLGGPRQDRLRPFFALERLANEGTSFYGFERQLSEVSESKVSSVPDTESVSTCLEEDDKKIHEHEADRGIERVNVDTETDHEEDESSNEVAEITLGGGEDKTSGNLETDDDDDHIESESSLSEEEEEAQIPKIEERETSMSSDERETELESTREEEDDKARGGEDSFLTARPSLEESELRALCSLVDEHHHHKEPKYDSSPPSASRFPSFSSVSSDTHAEMPREIGIKESEVESVETSKNIVAAQSDIAVSSPVFEDAQVDPYSDKDDNSPLPVSSQEDPEEVYEDEKESVQTRASDNSTLSSPTADENETIHSRASDNNISSLPAADEKEGVHSRASDNNTLSSPTADEKEGVHSRASDNNTLSFPTADENEIVHSGASDHNILSSPTADENETVQTRASDNKTLSSPTADENETVHSRASNNKTLSSPTADENETFQTSASDNNTLSSPTADEKENVHSRASDNSSMSSPTADENETLHSVATDNNTLSSPTEDENETVQTRASDNKTLSSPTVDENKNVQTRASDNSILSSPTADEKENVQTRASDNSTLSSPTADEKENVHSRASDNNTLSSPTADENETVQTRASDNNTLSSPTSDEKENVQTRASDNSTMSSPTSDEKENVQTRVSDNSTMSSPTTDENETVHSRASDNNTLPPGYLASPTVEEAPHSDSISHEEEEASKAEAQAAPVGIDSDNPIDSYSTLSSGAVEYVETHSFNEEEVPKPEQDQGQSSTFDTTKEDCHLHGAIDIEDQNAPREETSPYESDRETMWSDKSIVDQSDLQHEPQQPARPLGVVFSRNITFHEYHDAEEEDAAELSGLTSDSSSSPPLDSPEYQTPMVGEGDGADFFNETLYEDLYRVSEPLDQPAELDEMDEDLLSELDTVGDFRVTEAVTDSEAELDEEEEKVEALPVLEARSVEDIQSAFQQIHEGSEIEEVILPSTIQDQLALERSEASIEARSELEVVDASSIKDLDNAMKRAVELNSPESIVEERSRSNAPKEEEAGKEGKILEPSERAETVTNGEADVESSKPQEPSEPSGESLPEEKGKEKEVKI